MRAWVVFFVLSFAAWAGPDPLPEPFQQFVHFDSFFNDKTLKAFDTAPFELKAIEFPLSVSPRLHTLNTYWDWFTHPSGTDVLHSVFVDEGPNLPARAREMFVITRGGQRYVRWPIHPMDSTFHPVIVRYLLERGIPFQVTSPWIGHFTSSRSVLVTDPKTGYTVSMRTSTNHTTQGDQLRAYPMRFVHLVRRLSDYYFTMERHLRALKIAYEPFAVGFPAIVGFDDAIIDQGFSIRLMDELNSQPKYYHVSGFVLNSDRGIQRLCELSGLKRDDLIRRLQKAYGEAMVELNLVLGFRFISAHGQNIRFEFDEHWQPTGRVVLLDLSDGRPIGPVMRARGQHELLHQWQKLLRLIGSDSTNAIWEAGDFFQSQFVDLSGHTQLGEALIQKAALDRAHELFADFEAGFIARHGTSDEIEYRFKSSQTLGEVARSLRPLGQSTSRADSCHKILDQQPVLAQ